MKIALITNSRIPSLTANSIQAMKVAQALMQLGHDARMFAPAETEPVSQQLLITHYGVRLIPPLELLPSISGLKRLDFIVHAQRAAQKFGAELIYTWLPQSAALALWMKYPVVLEMHADVTGLMGAWWLRQFWNAKGKKTMTVTTSALRNVLERSTKLKLENEAVIVAPNGVELERYASLPSPSEARRQLNLPDGLTVGFTGHIYPGRGAELLFELAKQMPHVKFLWVGGTPELVSFWKSKLAQGGVANVTMTGFVEHSRIPLYQAAADVLLMPYSRTIEASSGQDIAEVINPMKMFEYMAAGRAIVCADISVIREILNDKNAVFVESSGGRVVLSGAERSRRMYRDHNVGELENQRIGDWRLAIEALLADEPRRLALGAQARRDVERFSWVKREERVLEGIIK
ncbi:MAG TPA: glycosyltransferase [Anaerolineales bacterium]|jgi:glycosyltransferase involved in cell wall biosynthesis|nr:glycosyltransferase [Anaerolineales bacterium]